MGQFQFTKEAAGAEERILGDPLYQAEREHIVDFLECMRSATTAEDFMKLQVRLIGRTKARQQLASELRDQEEGFTAELAELVRQTPKPIPGIRSKQDDLEMCRHQRAVSEALRWNLLSVGDGLAWKALGYDRGGITILGLGDRTARFADDLGFRAEIAAIEQLWHEGTFALHNDLTTCLRHGDVTAVIPGPDARHRRIELIEVKAGRSAGDDAPQLRRLERATRLLNEGRIEQEDGSILNFHRTDVPYRTQLANLRDLLSKARRDGYAAAKVGSCYHAATFYYPARQGQVAELAGEHQETRKRLGWPGRDRKAFEWWFAARRMRDRRYSFPGLAPVSIFPFEVEDVADLMMGFLDALVCLDGRRLEAHYASKGLSAEVVTGPEADRVFLNAGRVVDDYVLGVQVSPMLREQMLLELVTPENAVALTEALVRIMSRQPRRDGTRENHVVVPANERAVWED